MIKVQRVFSNKQSIDKPLLILIILTINLNISNNVLPFNHNNTIFRDMSTEGNCCHSEL